MQPLLLAHFQRLVAADRLSQAYLFGGGFGSFEMAIYLAKALFCEQVTEGKPDERCRVCQLIDRGEFADLHLVRPDGQSIKVDQIRTLLSELVTSGFESEHKVVIIREAERLNRQAANSLLKTIEEPDSQTTIFLLTENVHRLLPTIRSRVQLVNFPRHEQLLADSLEKAGVLKSVATLVSQLTDSETDAIALARASWFEAGLKALSQLCEMMGTKPDEAFLAVNRLTDIFEDKKHQELALEMLLILLRQRGSLPLLERTFRAQRYFRANVTFKSALESVCL